jgi:two-component system, chemotaxis family, sensor kinase Cph1
MAIRLKNQAAKLEALNKELQVRAEQLKTKNVQLENFAHIITHNLRSPMANIHSLYELYQNNPNQEKGGFIMEKIKKVSDNMLATIEDLSVILQARTGQKIQQEKVDLAEIIEKEKQNLGAVIAETQAEIKTELQISHITIPKIYIESIIHNLLSNALKYRSKKRKPLISIKSELNENEQLTISISDNGLGMDLNKVGPNVFGLYKIFHNNKDAKGLGLYLTKLQVESLGGKIFVESQPDQGTTFTIKLALVH